MELLCPHCRNGYEYDFETLPAKVYCPVCSSKSLVHEDGSMELLVAGEPVLQPEPEFTPAGEAPPRQDGAWADPLAGESEADAAAPIPAPPRRAAVESDEAPHGPQVHRPVAAAHAAARPRAPRPTRRLQARSQAKSWSGPLSVLGLLLAAAILMSILQPEWRDAALPRLGYAPKTGPVVAQTPPEAAEDETPAPVPNEPPPAAPAVVDPNPVADDEPEEPRLADEEPDAADDDGQGGSGEAPPTLAEVAPEIAQALEVTDQRIAAAPGSAEAEVRAFLGALYRGQRGSSRASALTGSNPELVLGLLGDIWQRIEDSPDANLPATPELKIFNGNTSRFFDLTTTYRELFTAAVEDGPVEDGELGRIAQEDKLRQLLGHFAEGRDDLTVANALMLGRMIHNIRLGKQPLEGASSAAVSTLSIADLPDVDRDVDLAGFDSVQELVQWAHDLKPTQDAPVSISGGEGSEEQRSRSIAYLNLPAEVLLPHPCAAEFPGSVPVDAERVEREVTINLAMPRWQATGLYAAPGEPITLRVPSKLQRENLRVRIGSHSDNLVKTKPEESVDLHRFPQLTNSFPLDDDRVVVGNPFGGQIFIEVPFNERSDDIVLTVGAFGDSARAYEELPQPEPVTLNIAGAVEMPTWRPGMSNAEWQDELKKPAPWAELNFGPICMTVPSAVAREARDLDKLTDYWATVMRAEWEFGGFPGLLYIPQRVNWDRQISNGYMHSGYPIGAPAVDALSAALDYDALKEAGSWGLFHEIGHNHQPQVMTPEGFTEVTVNLFSLAAMKGINPKGDPNDGHPALADPDDLLKQLRAGNREEPFVALATFLPCIEEFGFESITRTFQVYWEEDNENGRLKMPADNDAKEDLWVRRYGEVVERNVAPFFESVHYHVSDRTRDALAKYDEWNP